jgi:hypothetical protein
MIPFKPIQLWESTDQIEELESLQTSWRTEWAKRHQYIPNDTLYHYTTIHGLEGILKSGKLWMTKAEYLNDSTEIRYGERVVDELLADARIKYREEPEVIELINHITSPEMSSHFASLFKNDLKGVFLACFCENSDLLTERLWTGSP